MSTTRMRTRPHEDGRASEESTYRVYVLLLLLGLYFLQTLDRGILQVLLEPIKHDLKLSDGQLGFLVGPAFAVVFAVGGIPLGLLADRWSRKKLMLICLSTWSALTAACGLAQSFGQMVLARMGVGIGEAGGGPTAVSIIADTFPPERRASAVSVFYIGGSFGILAIFWGGAYIAAHHGWRIAFILSGSLGVILALLILFTLREPHRGGSDGLAATTAPTSARTTYAFMCSQRSIVHTMMGMIMFQVTGTAIMGFMASFLIRSHGYTLEQVGMFVAFAYGVANLIGIVCGGLMADMLARRDTRWRTRVGCIASLAAGACLLVTCLAETRVVMAIGFCAWSLACGLFVGPTYGLFQSLVKPNMRATISAVQSVLGFAVGGSIGPVIVGFGSDWYSAAHGMESLRYALLLMAPFYAWGALHYWLAGRTVASDLDRAKFADIELTSTASP